MLNRLVSVSMIFVQRSMRANDVVVQEHAAVISTPPCFLHPESLLEHSPNALLIVYHDPPSIGSFQVEHPITSLSSPHPEPPSKSAFSAPVRPPTVPRQQSW